ncbi:serine/threonine-protein kinase [Melittangium boletus]|uniref:Serine/threonine protein kinase n=1 Tax=Melittangium boletus DSM 14713 TaxID=1294270 RepID=A0A250I9R7_9BACT|nr:serine/threonine-protein kinase [Melittangium boletus]ATB27902.1 serine/threonine protein kinase [Melittangium boletus DSM 14713]
MTTTQPKRQPIPFGKYLLLDRINIGGMAEVWRGKMFGAGGFERLVAIKRILPNIAEDDEFISMFIDEAKISVQLNHANVAKIEELGQIANNYFIAMEYIPGKDMRAIFDRGRKKSEPAPVPLVAYMVSKMCEGLDYAHRKKDGMGRDLNIVHRDISPQNVLISFEGEVKVIDFGIAKAAGKATKTQAGILKGKFGYMSPEQIRGLPLDRRSDIFAIGVCLYEMLTGERLFVGDSDFSVLEKVRKAEVAPPSTYNRRIPEALEKIVLKALARDVDERYQYANELGDDLQRFLITSDSIFSRKDLMQYMKSTFAEDVEREKQRLQEYADIKPPEGMLAAIEMGFGSNPISPHSTPQLSSPPQVEPAAPPPAGVRRSPTMAAMPRLTAAPVAPPKEEEESGATQVVNGSEYFNDSPTGEHVSPGRMVTPVEVPRSPMLEESPPPRAAPRLSHPSMPRPPVLAPSNGESTTVGRQSRNTLDGIPRVGRSDELSGGARASLSSPAVGSRPPPPVVPPPVDDLTEDGLPPAPPPQGRMPVAAPRSQPAAQTPAAAAPPAAATSSRLPPIIGIVVLVLVMLGGVGMLLMRPAPTGFVLVSLPHDVQGKNPRVSYNGKDLDVPKSGPILQQVNAGPAVVLVSVEGYKPFTQTVQVASGMTPTRVDVELQREARMAQLIVVTQPADAELKLDGKVVRPKGDSKTYVSEVPAGPVVVLEASAPGFKPKQERVSPTASAPTDVRLTLEADSYQLDVQSVPSGATIVAGGKELGLTPSLVTVPASVKQVRLKLDCYTEVDVPVAPGSNGAVRVNERLKKVKGRCNK